MPKKTRKEKMLAQARKQHNITYTVSEVTPAKESSSVQSKARTNIISPELKQEEDQIRSYFIKDLKKSLLIIGCVFALEFFFYFATMSNILSKYLNF